jgi:hypothetical protein
MLFKNKKLPGLSVIGWGLILWAFSLVIPSYSAYGNADLIAPGISVSEQSFNSNPIMIKAHSKTQIALAGFRGDCMNSEFDCLEATTHPPHPTHPPRPKTVKPPPSNPCSLRPWTCVPPRP